MTLDIILFVVGGFFILYYIISTLALGPVSFSAVLLALGCILVLLGVLDRKFGQLTRVVKLKKVLIPIAITALIIFAVLEAVVISGAVQKDRT